MVRRPELAKQVAFGLWRVEVVSERRFSPMAATPYSLHGRGCITTAS